MNLDGRVFLTLVNIEMNLDGEQEDANETEVKDRVDDNSSGTGVKVAKLQASTIARKLKQQAWC